MNNYKFFSNAFLFFGIIFFSIFILGSTVFMVIICILYPEIIVEQTIATIIIFIMLSFNIVTFLWALKTVCTIVILNQDGLRVKNILGTVKTLTWQQVQEVGIGFTPYYGMGIGYIYFSEKPTNPLYYEEGYYKITTNPRMNTKKGVIALTLQKKVLKAVEEFYHGEIKGYERYKLCNSFYKLIK